jgi:exodeoxyribonuclease III
MKKNKIYLFLALFISITLLHPSYGQGNFKILSYNVLYGFQSDSVNKSEYVSWVKGIDPDIIAYQEMNGFTQKSIEEFAARYGHPYAVISKTEGFPVALSSKYPIVNVQKVVDNMHHAYLVANINKINVIVIHFSPFSYKKRNLEVNEVLARAALFSPKEEIVIMGDFNSLSSLDDEYYKDEGYLRTMQEKELKEKHIRNLNNGKIDYTVTGSMIQSGYIDLVRKFHSDMQFSIPTKKYGTEYPKRIDFIWANPSFAKEASSAIIIHDEKTDKMSDHYPVLATFQIRGKK